MEPKINKVALDLEIQIEELEPKVAPDGSEQVMPLGGVTISFGGHHHG